MSERAAGIGGSLGLDNDPGGGAVVRLDVPFRPVAATGVAPSPQPGAGIRATGESAPGAATEPTPETAAAPEHGAAPVTA